MSSVAAEASRESLKKVNQNSFRKISLEECLVDKMTTSTPNDSFNTSDQLMDLSIKNFWVVVHYPYSDPGSEFEILSKKDLVFDSWEVIERGAVVTVKYGNARVQGIVVTVSDDYNGLSANFPSIVEEYNEIHQFEEKSKKYFEKHGNRSDFRHIIKVSNKDTYYEKPGNRSDFRHIIKVADKKTQTDAPAEAENVEYAALKRHYEELQSKYDDLRAAVTEVKSELQGAVLRLDSSLVKSEEKSPHKAVLQPANDNAAFKENTKQMVQIGSGGTKIPRHVYNSIKWTSYSAATRKLLITLFPRSVLATHSLTGKPSPAFISTNKQAKMKLNPAIIADIIEIIAKKCLVSESLVRNAITTKCADENKMYKKRLEKKQVDENESNAAKKIKLSQQ